MLRPGQLLVSVTSSYHVCELGGGSRGPFTKCVFLRPKRYSKVEQHSEGKCIIQMRRTQHKGGSPCEVDDIDIAIMKALEVNPQTSNKTISKSLSISEATVASRINALISNGLMKVTVQRNVRALGYSMVGMVEVYVEGRDPGEVGAQLALITQVFTATIAMSAPEVVLLVVAVDISDFLRVLEDEVTQVPGVARIASYVCLDIEICSTGIAIL